jgi:hypothetical protein
MQRNLAFVSRFLTNNMIMYRITHLHLSPDLTLQYHEINFEETHLQLV